MTFQAPKKVRGPIQEIFDEDLDESLGTPLRPVRETRQARRVHWEDAEESPAQASRGRAGAQRIEVNVEAAGQTQVQHIEVNVDAAGSAKRGGRGGKAGASKPKASGSGTKASDSKAKPAQGSKPKASTARRRAEAPLSPDVEPALPPRTRRMPSRSTQM